MMANGRVLSRRRRALAAVLVAVVMAAAAPMEAAADGTCASLSPWTADLEPDSWLRRDDRAIYCLAIAKKGSCASQSAACCGDADRPASLTITMDLACGLDTLNAIQWTVDGKNKDAIVNSDGTVELADLGRWGGDQDSKLVCAVIPQYAECHSFDHLCPSQKGDRCSYKLASEDGTCCRAAVSKTGIYVRPMDPVTRAMAATVGGIEGAYDAMRRRVARFKAEFSAAPEKAAAALPRGDARLAAEIARAAALPSAWDSRAIPTASGPVSVLTPVRYQEHCDSCIAFATTAGAEAAFLKAHLDAGTPLEPSAARWFSPYAVYFCTIKLKAGWRRPFQRKYAGQNLWCWNMFIDDGKTEISEMLLGETVDAILKTGFVPDACRPYTTHAGDEIREAYGSNRTSQADITAACRDARLSCKRHQAGFSKHVTRYVPPPQGGATNDSAALAFYADVKERIMASGGVVAQLQLYDDLYSYLPGLDGAAPNQVYRRGSSAKLDGGHGAVVVGWNDAGMDTDGDGDADGYWVVKNSWTDAWGYAGYGYIAYDAGVALFGSADNAARYPEAFDFPYNLAAGAKEAGGGGGGDGGDGDRAARYARVEPGGCAEHTVAHGESLASVAAAMGVPAGTLFNDNQAALKGAADVGMPAPGTVLRVCKPADCATSAECGAGAECRPNPFRGGQGECR